MGAAAGAFVLAIHAGTLNWNKIFGWYSLLCDFVAETVRLSRRTHAVLWQNIVLALGIKAVFLVLALAGQATMWMAVFADMGASLLVVGNGLRLLRGVR